MKRLSLLHLGIGNVGRMLQRYILSERSKLRKSLGVDLTYCGMFRSSGGMYQRNGLSEKEMRSPSLQSGTMTIEQAIGDISLPFIVVDTTASENTTPLLVAALTRGGYAVMSNKKPLAGSQNQWNILHEAGSHRLYYETTVGAGLPVISTIQSLIATGDMIQEIRGCLSGTLGFICSSLDECTSFSHAVLRAKEQGITEPDPREDLSGLDVARKALILARLLGSTAELKDISLTSLYPKELQNETIDDFLRKLSSLDDQYAKKVQSASEKGNTLRYTATITPTSCTVAMQEVEKASDIGQLNGPDNLVSIRTKRYDRHPLVIKGPGAGIKVTAAGALGDIVQIMKQVSLFNKLI